MSERGVSIGAKKKNRVIPKGVDNILPRLYMGGNSSSGTRQLVYYNIEVVVNCTRYERNYIDGIENMFLDLDDTTEQNIQKHFELIYKFIEESIIAGKNVLVHCFRGISRSATIVIMYVMRKKNMTFDEAFAFVKKKRSCIYPNKGFISQLKKFEIKLENKKG